jgi:hypothetical protein
MAPHPPFFVIVVKRMNCRAELRVSRATTTCVVRLPKLFNASRTGLKYPELHGKYVSVYGAKILEQKIQYLNLDDEIKCLLQIF